MVDNKAEARFMLGVARNLRLEGFRPQAAQALTIAGQIRKEAQK